MIETDNNKNLTLLVIDSKAHRLQNFMQSLPVNFNVVTINDTDDLNDTAQNQQPDCILLNMSIFKKFGISYLQNLANIFPTNKALFLTDTDDLNNNKLNLVSFQPVCELSMESIQHFQNLLNKSIMPPKLENVIGADLPQHYDELTRLPNRMYFKAIFKREIARCKADNALLAMLMLDVDRFKSVNDRLGHPYGDLLLKEIAKRLDRLVEANTYIARLGGDEFAVLLTHLNKEIDAGLLASKIIDLISQPYMIEKNEITIGASIGIALYPWNGNNPYVLAKHADIALYYAKEQGGNQYEYFTLNLKDKSRIKLSVESELKVALSKNQFYLKYQPIYRLPDLQIVGAESLLRWQHPEYGSMSILDVVKIAEDIGLILSIGEWIVKKAVAFQKKWQAVTDHPVYVSINLSAQQIIKEDIFKIMTDVCNAEGVDPKSIVLEITETTIMDKSIQSATKLIKLREKSFNIAIDDFGTGFSSLNYIKDLPINMIKIDKSFIDDINNSQDSAIVKKIIELAKAVNLSIIAEGVETREQLEFLIKHNCDCVQGYFLNKPLEEKDLLNLL